MFFRPIFAQPKRFELQKNLFHQNDAISNFGRKYKFLGQKSHSLRSKMAKTDFSGFSALESKFSNLFLIFVVCSWKIFENILIMNGKPPKDPFETLQMSIFRLS